MKRDRTAATATRTATKNARSFDSFRDVDPKVSRSIDEGASEGWREEHRNHRSVDTLRWLLGRS